ncbi:uncharacterized protein LOC111129413 [Crassostrea virginica]
MQKLNMKTTGFISNCKQWILLFTFLVNLHITVGADIKCKGPPGYDVSPLTEGKWTYKAVNQSCLAGAKVNAACNITLSFCNDIAEPPNCNSSSACVKASNFTGKNDSKEFSIGQYLSNPFSSSVAGNGFVASFGKVPYIVNSTTFNLTTVVEFNCNLQAVWKASTGNTSIPKTANLKSKLERKQNNEYQYTISVEYEGACVNILPPTSNTAELSAGTVLIIIFFVSISVYCIVGCSWNCIRGYKGVELLPQAAFWIDLPVLIADGIIFTFSCCKQESSAYDSI